MNLRTCTKRETAFVKDGFTNWKDALNRFRAHEASDCHKAAVEYEIVIPKTCGNTLDMSNDQTRMTRKTNRSCLMKIIENLQYFCRQGQAIQGDTEHESNFFQLMKLRGKDDPKVVEWLEKATNKYESRHLK